ncbi:hypothetical protein BA190_10345 [Labrys sp. WJW]|uniref:hypothetical protein n=1 Tax=Labrys sp. WJW TaxID=1737983 RepID=UPI0008302CB0|nr:hypothetical protein [Labrys sp. WJW]OCC05294.1 hypothetical protein BA190_10345 [Labrys sp. WJW]
MLLTRMIQHFSAVKTLPVDVNDVRDFLIANGVQDEITFVGVVFDPQIMLGQFKRFRRRTGVYGETLNCANVYYHAGAEANWQRFITCKELVHLANPEEAKSSSRESIVELVDKIGLPPGMQDAPNDGWATNVDRLAEYVAIALLLPLEARNILATAIADESIPITEADVPRIADIPPRYATIAMREWWPTSVQQLTSMGI